MRGVQVSALDGPTAVQVVDLPDPVPTAGQVLIEVHAAGVSFPDVLLSKGQYQMKPELPFVPGAEVAGVVLSAPDGCGFGPGDRVAAFPVLGGFAEQVACDPALVFALPGGVSYAAGAALPMNYLTVDFALVRRGDLRAGETVLVQGAAGGIGVASIQLASSLDARVIAVVSSPEKAGVARQAGADEVVMVDGFLGAVKELTGGRGVDVVYDAVGGDISLESLRCVRFGARHLIVGWAATPFVARGKGRRGAPNANVLPTNLVMMKGLDVLGCPTVISTVNDPSLRAPRLAQILAWVEEGKIRPYVSHVFALTDFKQAMRAKWNGDVIGGCVVHP